MMWRRVAWDGYIDVRGNRYSVPSDLTGQTVMVHIGLDDTLKVYQGDDLRTSHQLRAAAQGWVSVREHHAQLWAETVQVERRPLTVYEEAAAWS